MSKLRSRIRSLATIAAVALSTTAATASEPYGGPRPLSWTGFYVGANGGYSWGDADTDLNVATSARFRTFTLGGTLLTDDSVAGPSFATGGSADMNGWLGGVHAGYNWQSGGWVWGLEVDIQRTGQDGGLTLCAVTGCGAGTAFLTANHSLDWFGTVRARAGVLLQPTLLLYGTGGLAYGHVSSDYTLGLIGVAGSSTALSDDTTKAGWVIGAGLEGMLTRNWLLRAEYLYMDLGDVGGAVRISDTEHQRPFPGG